VGSRVLRARLGELRADGYKAKSLQTRGVMDSNVERRNIVELVCRYNGAEIEYWGIFRRETGILGVKSQPHFLSSTHLIHVGKVTDDGPYWAKTITS
jgi:hypothetical protein